MTYNFSTNSVDVAFDGDDDATAKTKKDQAIADAMASEREALKAAQVARDAAEA